MLGIRNCGFQSLLGDPRPFFRAESQDIERLRNRQTANLIGNQAAFLRGKMNISCNCNSRCHHASLFLDCGFFISGMSLEGARQGKLTQFVTHHVFGYIHRDMLLTVVYRNCQADELGQHRGTARPGFHRAFIVGRAHCLNLLEQVSVDKWTFFNRTCHVYYPLNLEATAHDHAARALVATCAEALGWHTPWTDRMTAGCSLTFAAAVRVIDRVHYHTEHGRAKTAPTHRTGLT